MTNPKCSREIEGELEEQESGIRVLLSTKSGEVHRVKITAAGKSFAEGRIIYPARVLARALNNDSGAVSRLDVQYADVDVNVGFEKLEMVRKSLIAEREKHVN
jgi:hypothetical protein